MTKEVWLKVTDPEYFKQVIKNMEDLAARHNGRVAVRFGLNGNSIRPNYQLEMHEHDSRRITVAMRGDTHGRSSSGRYRESELSRKIPLPEVEDMRKRCANDQIAVYRDKPLGEDKEAIPFHARDDLEGEVARLARELSPPSAFDEHVTLRVFQKIKEDERLHKLYDLASLAPSNRGRLNQFIGAKVKEALGAEIQTTANGSPKTKQVRDQLILGYTRLRPG